MKKALFIVLLLFILFSIQAQEQQAIKKYNILLTGASFASIHNGWFELGCEKLNANSINRAVPGESIAEAANKIAEGTLYTEEAFDSIDVFVIMHVHDRDVFDETQLNVDYHDYKLPFDRSNYAIAFDYIIKKYISDCYRQKDNPKSKYYKTEGGKPPVIILCTDWHDGRTIYNESVRKLGSKWGIPLVEFDKYIGFSKDQLHPVTGKQTSLIFSQDTQDINGVTFGWHPRQGKNEYIQHRMAAIFVELMNKILF